MAPTKEETQAILIEDLFKWKNELVAENRKLRQENEKLRGDMVELADTPDSKSGAK